MKLFDSAAVFVQVRGDDLFAGTLAATFAGGRVLGGCSFEYDAEYLHAPHAYALSPELPVESGRRFTGEDSPMFGAFADVAPDDWGENLIDASLARARLSDPAIPSPVGKFDYLTQSDDHTRMGAIRLKPDQSSGRWIGSTTATGLRSSSVQRIVEAADRFQNYEATDEDIEVLECLGSSLGGARPKASVLHNGHLSILKLPSTRDGRRDGEAWERVGLILAERSGIRTSRSELFRLEDGKSALLVERFDRDRAGCRLGYLSAQSAMELGEQRKATYEDFSDYVSELTNSPTELEEMFRRVALTVLINNTDDHWKNHGFLRQGGSWKLSPAFDINPARVRGRAVSRAISADDDPTQRDIRNLFATASSYALSRREAARIIGTVAQVVADWGSVARSCGISDGEISDMSTAFDGLQLDHARQIYAKSG
ncbi:MAG: type II toxin-antitoxin system HipA family toxin [Leucobacter sp.]